MEEDNIQPRDIVEPSLYSCPYSNYLCSTPFQVNTPYTPAASFVKSDLVRLDLNLAIGGNEEYEYREFSLFNSSLFKTNNNDREIFNLTNNDIILKKLSVPLSTRTIQKDIVSGEEVLLGEIFLPDSTFNNDCVAFIMWCPTLSMPPGDIYRRIEEGGCRIIKAINVPFDGDSGFVEGVTGSARSTNLPDMCIRYPETLWVVFEYSGMRDELLQYPSIPVSKCYVNAAVTFTSNVSVYDSIVSDGLN